MATYKVTVRLQDGSVKSGTKDYIGPMPGPSVLQHALKDSGLDIADVKTAKVESYSIGAGRFVPHYDYDAARVKPDATTIATRAMAKSKRHDENKARQAEANRQARLAMGSGGKQKTR